MSPEKVLNYRKSIRYELIRAKIAFEEFFQLSIDLVTGNIPEDNIVAKIKGFDAYSRWVGHLYESLLALVIIEDQNSVTENSSSDVIDKEIQWEAQKAINRIDALFKSGKLDKNGYVKPDLFDDFSNALRKVRNKCSFHCTSNRVQSDILQEFMNKHHHMAFRLYEDFYADYGKLNSEFSKDLGAINEFFNASKRAIGKGSAKQ
jgi:hypothetical protein